MHYFSAKIPDIKGKGEIVMQPKNIHSSGAGVDCAPNRRTEERRNCDIKGTLTYYGQTYSCNINDITSSGSSITLVSIVELLVDDEVTLRSKEIGDLQCQIRWASHPRYGMKVIGDASTTIHLRDLYNSL